MYKISCIVMLVGFLAVSIQMDDLRGKLVGILLTIVNYLIFWK